MNITIVNDFIRFYIEKFDDKTKFNEFIFPWIQEKGSKLIHNNNIYTDKTLMEFLQYLYIGKIYDNVLTTYNIDGNRRASILMNYKILNPDSKKYDVSQSIFLNYSNNNKYWIQSCLIIIREIN